MHNIFFYAILAILILEFVFERWLEYLNDRNWSDQLPDELEGIYDSGEYARSRQYDKDKGKLDVISSSLNFVLVLAMIIFGGFAYIDNIAYGISANPIWNALIFFGIIMIAADILGLPFSLYGTFVIEEKYGFNKTTLKTFILDKIKGYFIGAIIGGGLLALIIWFYQITGKYFWLVAWGAVSAFTILMTMFYSQIIVPMFNKQEPLEEGELRTEIEEFSDKVDFKLKNIFVMDGSKRSTKANAYFTGLGPQKRIVLFDTLIQDLKIKEIVAVLAHEIGHFKKKHTLTFTVISLIQTGLMFYILSIFLKNEELSYALGSDRHSFHLALITFGILFSPISTILGLGTNILSRKNEYSADRFAAIKYEGKHLIEALKKLSVNSLSNLTPHRLYVFFHYSHPPLLQRIRAINTIEKNES